MTVPFKNKSAPCVNTGTELSYEWSHHRNRPQTQKLGSPYKTPSNTLVVKELKAKRARSIDRIPDRMLGINFETRLFWLSKSKHLGGINN